MQNWELHDYRKKQPTPMTLYDWGLCLGFSYLFYTSLTINIILSPFFFMFVLYLWREFCYRRVMV